jgi:hypothetical protein
MLFGLYLAKKMQPGSLILCQQFYITDGSFVFTRNFFPDLLELSTTLSFAETLLLEYNK